MPTEDQAVQLLEELGLTEYEARCFVRLLRVRKASAKEVSDLSEVPRSRVYDALERLHRRGLVDVQQSDPRQYRALSKEAALDVLREGYGSTLDAADEALSGLRRSEHLEEEGAWAIADHDHVTNRIGSLIEGGEDEVYVLVADDGTLDRKLYDLLAAAADRGMTVLVEVPSEDAKERIREEVPSAKAVVTTLADDPAEIEGKWLGRLVMVDRWSVLISAVTDKTLPGRRTETAIWASGPDHGLVVGLRHFLGARIDDSDVLD
jgi:HTH-type transcriptional regulator, sugar sensing transcriptional regulator